MSHKNIKKIIITFLTISIILLPPFITAKNLPIVLVHGILSNTYSMIPAEKHIKENLPDVYVKNIKLGEGKLASVFNMHDQVQWLKEEMEADANLCDGCIIVAHSQGGLVARYFIEKYNNPRVYVYISWGAPEAGIFGAPDHIDTFFPWLKILEKCSYRFTYSYFVQRLVSFAGYWKDPFHYDAYRHGCNFLPIMNNEIEHPDSALFKDNISNLACMVLVQSTEDEIVVPVESCHFGFYHKGSQHKIEHLFDSQWYNTDKLGLKTLKESGRLHLRFAYCGHSELQADPYNFFTNTLPFLSSFAKAPADRV